MHRKNNSQTNTELSNISLFLSVSLHSAHVCLPDVCLVCHCNGTQWVMCALCLWEIPPHTHACVISHLWPNTSAMQSSDSFHLRCSNIFYPWFNYCVRGRQKYPCWTARQTDVEAGVDACILCQSGGSYRLCPLPHCFIRSASGLHTAAADV